MRQIRNAFLSDPTHIHEERVPIVVLHLHQVHIRRRIRTRTTEDDLFQVELPVDGNVHTIDVDGNELFG